MIEILKVIFLGIVEGVTEWLPVSSTGHMILVDEFIKLDVSAEFMKMFLVVIQLGAILAVVLIYWHKIFPFDVKNKVKIRPQAKNMQAKVMILTVATAAILFLFGDIFGNILINYLIVIIMLISFAVFVVFDFTDSLKVKPQIMTLWFKILVATLPAAIIGILFDDVFDRLFYNYQTVAIMLILFGVFFIVVENLNKGKSPRITKLSDITYKDALIIGGFQVIAAVFPGTSRSGATIVGGLLFGVSRFVATEFTFFMAIPVMFGASLLKLVKFGFAFTLYEGFILLLGMFVAFVVSIFAIKFLLNYLKKNDFKAFGWYRIILGILVLTYFLLIA